MFLLSNYFEDKVNYWMSYNSDFESLTNLQSIVHIINFYKECKRNSSNDTIDFKLFILKNHDSLYAITCSLGQVMKTNHMKQKATRKMIILLNHLASSLYSLGSKFLTLDVVHM